MSLSPAPKQVFGDPGFGTISVLHTDSTGAFVSRADHVTILALDVACAQVMRDANAPNAATTKLATARAKTFRETEIGVQIIRWDSPFFALATWRGRNGTRRTGGLVDDDGIASKMA